MPQACQELQRGRLPVGVAALQEGLRWEGARETAPNQGPVVAWAIEPWTTRRPGPWSAWCAGFAATCVLQALRRRDPFSQLAETQEWLQVGSLQVSELWERCSKRGWTAAAEPSSWRSGWWQQGDLVFWKDPGHVGIVEAGPSPQEPGFLRTFEGNTAPGPGLPADRAMRRRRALADPRLLGRARIPYLV